ncbi:small ubiquitin-related modifier 3-like isoform X2 [Aphis gossypii]|uniref:small ubiquitin-related modifier 3-like isoform X2 n=1 Tax=Aphis gossypii TaxID=80765 RepID=UPI00215950E6|nr:small ubiquitin-related modifier 3-like isoform X2 [Aphis gossypii]
MAEDRGDASEYINIKVIGEDNRIIKFKMRQHTPLKKLMNAYCERTGRDIANTRFRHYGERFDEDDTPCSTNMEEGDTIEAFQAQIGG